MRKQQDGITLVGLVVTIIVLLILAGVTISLVLGQAGIFNKAGEAKINTEIGQEKEAIKLSMLTVKTDKVTNVTIVDKTITAEDLNMQMQQGDPKPTSIAEIQDTAMLKVTFLSGRSYQVDVSGNIALLENNNEEADEPLENAVIGEIAKNGNQIYTDEQGKTATIPKGFAVSKDETEQTIADGLVIKDKEFNEFVWIPVDNFNNFKRIEGYMYKSGGMGSSELDSMLPNCEEAGSSSGVPITGSIPKEASEMYGSVKKNKGFYIARYEAGREITNPAIDGSIKPISKKGAKVWTSIPWGGDDTQTASDGLGGNDQADGAVKVARSMYPSNASNETGATSTLVYGVQWDAVMSFIDPDYLTSNCDSANSFVRNSYKKGNFSTMLYSSGNSQLFKVKNIYDLAGNAFEWTMEAYNKTKRVRRGPRITNSSNPMPASERSGTLPSVIGPVTMSGEDWGGFRVALYL